jgi:hypothetical protein
MASFLIQSVAYWVVMRLELLPRVLVLWRENFGGRSSSEEASQGRRGSMVGLKTPSPRAHLQDLQQQLVLHTETTVRLRSL